ncbi:DUF2637 domain-containing protein [Streptomyces kanamyceticus]|uniref:DUF2637 domain-containing protein n=1 Tax=Streptomyces kanamyceticus TaxID=1967 RepID=A0A5J6GUZ1_STRKN|nr:DUF2637 domain-containing protein [Streptomyces kanamyceticus]QEU97735.1 DUF2637 domain-containing protein [Streptomyces kanamyceticus]
MIRSIRPDAVLIQAVIAGALSFAHLHDLAAAAGQDDWKAWAYPVSVDLLLVAAWRRLRSDGPSRLAWSWFLIALAASLGANVATAGFLDLQHPPDWLRFGIAGWPALAFLGGTLLAHAPDRGADDPTPSLPPNKIAVEDLKRDGPVASDDSPAQLPIPEPPPSLVAADPAPAAVVPPALVAHARKLADDHHTRTGVRIDPATLCTRLGVPAPLADAIAAQLT